MSHSNLAEVTGKHGSLKRNFKHLPIELWLADGGKVVKARLASLGKQSWIQKIREELCIFWGFVEGSGYCESILVDFWGYFPQFYAILRYTTLVYAILHYFTLFDLNIRFHDY